MSSQRMKDRIRDYFLKPPSVRSVFYLSSRSMSGIHVSPKEGKIKNYFITPLERGLIVPSFNKKNIEKGSRLEGLLRKGLDKLHLSDSKIACLVPELSLKAFVFSFDSLPPSKQEREEIIRFRVKKQMAFLPEDARLSFEVMKSDHSQNVIVSVARASIIAEYEDFFRQAGLKVRIIGSPLLNLYNLVLQNKGEEFLLINIEEESLGLLAVVESEIAFYRQKPLAFQSEADTPSKQRLEEIIREIENTVHFVEDKEKKKITSLLARWGQAGMKEEMYSRLKKALSIPVKGIDVSGASELALEEKHFLSPLLGMIL